MFAEPQRNGCIVMGILLSKMVYQEVLGKRLVFEVGRKDVRHGDDVWRNNREKGMINLRKKDGDPEITG